MHDAHSRTKYVSMLSVLQLVTAGRRVTVHKESQMEACMNMYFYSLYK